MNNENCNYTYRGYNIVIRNDNGVVRVGKVILESIENHPTNDLRAHLEKFVDAYIAKQSKFDKIKRKLCGDDGIYDNILGDNILRGLQQQPKTFAMHIVSKLEELQKIQQDPCVRFGITGIIKDGKAGYPNYQIEFDVIAVDDAFVVKKQPFRHSHSPYAAEEFDQERITSRLTLDDIKTIWSIPKKEN